MLRRRSQDEQTASATVTAEPADRGRNPQAPKGRPTPKRADARNQRRTAASAAGKSGDRKEAARRVRDARREEMVKRREALAGGDERYLPARDRGKVRRAARDHIDARWHVAELFLPLAIIILVLSMLPSVQAKNISLVLWAGLIVLILGQSVVTGMSLKRALAKRFPNENLRGVTLYALMRSLQMRRMRLPKPQVKRGEKV